MKFENLISDNVDLITKSVTTGLKSRCVYTLSLASVAWRIQPAIKKIFPNICEYVTCEYDSRYPNGYKIEYFKDIDNNISKRDIFDFIIYKNTPIVLNVVKNQINPNDSRTENPDIYISTLRTQRNIKNIKDLIEKMLLYSAKESAKNWHALVVMNETRNGILRPVYIPNHKFRTFNDVFVPDEYEYILKSTVDKFISNKDWYTKNNIPYHLGIMLYGPGGTGKSSLAQAIADYVKAELRVLPGDRIEDLPDMLFGMGEVPSTDQYRVILIEDIDCGFKNMKLLMDRDRFDNDNGNNGINNTTKGFASILNSLDGLLAPFNVIYVFTTNHIEKLDPALIRPGRIDIKLNIDYLNKETFKKFCKFYYNAEPDDDEIKNIKPGLTFAELQIHVMKGLTMEQMIEFVQNN